MKVITRFLILFTAVFPLIFGNAFAKAPVSHPSEGDDKTLSPYFFVKSDDPAVDQLPLKSTSAMVNISGVISDVQVTQVYKNEGKKPLEAIYIFPASTRAAVYGMKMTIGKRVIEAKIKKREEARQDYEKAKQEGRSASLLEQQRPNVFQMNVANIMPGDEIKVELKYTELLVPENRVYQFVYPTVAGPRYSNKNAETASPSEKWLQNPYLHEGEAPPYTFDITVNIATGMAIKELVSPSHKVIADYSGPAAARVILDKSEKSGGNRDYILSYRLDGDKIQSGLLLFKGEKENFFLLMMQPPKHITNTEIPGREYIFIVDVSGSMHGFPLEISKKLLQNLIENLRATDKFNVLLFSGGSTLMSEESLLATSENIRKAINVIDRQQGGGGTELLPALKRALSLKKTENYARTIIIATDGYVAVEEEAFDLIRNNLNDANMFAFGIGTSVNRHIIEGMAHVGMGESFVITKPGEAPERAEHFRAMIQSPILTKVKVKFNGFAAYDVEPPSIPDVLAERPVIVFGKWRGTPQGTITLSGIPGSGKYTDKIDVGNVKPAKTNAALQYLWARYRISLLSDYNMLRADDKRIKEVTDLGLTYNLLTAYTSFVAVDTEIRNQDGKPTTVKQPLPLPQGVSNYAVGGTMAGMAMRAPMLAAQAPMKGEALYDTVKSKKQDAEEPKISVKDVAVSGEISKEAILAVVQTHLNDFEKCCTENGLKGKFVMTLTINMDGTIKDVKIISGASKNKNGDQCIIEAIKKWKLPVTTDGNEAKAKITIMFTP
ncbi:MAG: VIT domain-containing protein [Proteobacteria bacterium]|nr:VIT domain-containing protein [Pseudomonadota bacterium]